MKWFCFILVFTASMYAFSQDERYFRDMLNNSALKTKELMDYKVEVQSPFYVLDLNQDSVEDSFQFIKRDGLDYFRINDPFGKMKIEYKLDSKGRNSRLIKANLKLLNKGLSVLVLQYYEGEVGHSLYESSARLYFVTIRDNDLDKITVMKGPYYFHEKLDSANKYLLRNMSINLVDYNQDGMSEISVSYNKIQRVYRYIGLGKWKSI